MAVKCGEIPLAIVQPSGDPVGTGGQDAAHAERPDERVDVQLDDDERVDQPDHQPEDAGRRRCRGPKPWPLAWNQMTMQTAMPRVPPMDRSNAPQATGTIRPMATHGRDGLRPGDDPRVGGRVEQARNPQREDQDQRRPHVNAAEPVQAQGGGDVPPPGRCWPAALASTSGSGDVCLSTVILGPLLPTASRGSSAADRSSLTAGQAASAWSRPMVAAVIKSWSIRPPEISSAIRPRRKTSTRWHSRTSSSWSVEATSTAVPCGGRLVDELVDVGLGADVHPLGGLVEDEHLGLQPQPAGQHDLLLVPAGQVGHRELALPRPHVQALQPLIDV